MKAIGYREPGPIERPDSLIEFELPQPVPQGRDLLVQVQAVSVNPVDTKVRRNAAPAAGETRVLGFDAVGVVHAVGGGVSLFEPGDVVWYAGAIDRPGSNSEFQLVDERIVGYAPRTLAPADAAALPLTGITAWELLFDRLQVPRAGSAEAERAEPATLLVVGAAGGVGSVLVQLARGLTDLVVVGTASRPETIAWATEMGAHHTVDHHQPLQAQIEALGVPPVRYVASLTQTDRHFAQIVELMAPQGRFALIDDPEPIDVRLLKRKSISLHWELMFTRSLFQTSDMIAQHDLLEELARLVDEETVRSTARAHYGRITAANLQRAHALQESGAAIGKTVLAGF